MASKSGTTGGSRDRKAQRPGKQPSLTLTVGEELEYRIMRLFVAQGYVVRRGVEIYTEQYLNRATDLDVLALRFIPPFRRYAQIAECKSGSNRPLDRIFWLSGVKSYSGADSATFVRDNSTWDIKDFARRNGVELLDKKSLADVEQTLSIDTTYWPGLADKAFVQSQCEAWTKAIRPENDILLFFSFIASEFRWTREMSSIRYIIFMMRRLTRLAVENPQASVWRMLLTECFVQLCIFNLSFAGHTIGLSPDDVEGLARKDLRYGTLDTRVVERMLIYSMKLSQQVLESLGVSGKRVRRDDFEYPDAPHADETLKIFWLVQRHPKDAVSLAAFADYVLSERYVKQLSRLPWLGRTIPGTSLQVVGTIAKGIADVLESIDAAPPGFASNFDMGDLSIIKSRVPMTTASTSSDAGAAHMSALAPAESTAQSDETTSASQSYEWEHEGLPPRLL